MTDAKTEAPSSEPVQTKGTEPPTSAAEIATASVPSTGRRSAFRDVRRQLTDAELSSPGVQKLLLDMLEDADTDRHQLEPYVNQFHEADKRAAVLTEKLKINNAVEIFFGVGVGLGGAIIGLAPFFWEAKAAYGVLTCLIGLALTIGATVGRMVKQ